MRPDARIDTLAYGRSIDVNAVRVSLHPAGHVLGSAQVRIEHKGQVAVVSGDYKVEPDGVCSPFEPVRCHLFVSESTFALPIYRWKPQHVVFGEINAWWSANKAKGLASVLLAYSLGKSQRLLSGLDTSIGPIYVHGAVEPINAAHRRSGVILPETTYVMETLKVAKEKGSKIDWSSAMILAPPSAVGTPWMRRFQPFSAAFVSGWMTIRGTRRRQALDKGFVLSDHADWPGLLSAIDATEAEEVWLTHGYSSVLARYLNDTGISARSVDTRFAGESDVSDAAGDSTEIVEDSDSTAESDSP
jgi:putative mRNA 3-end processing factor